MSENKPYWVCRTVYSEYSSVKNEDTVWIIGRKAYFAVMALSASDADERTRKKLPLSTLDYVETKPDDWIPFSSNFKRLPGMRWPALDNSLATIAIAMNISFKSMEMIFERACASLDTNANSAFKTTQELNKLSHVLIRSLPWWRRWPYQIVETIRRISWKKDQ